MNFHANIQELIQNLQLNVFDEDFTKEQMDLCLVNYLQSARNLLSTKEQIDKIKLYLKIVLEYSWEKLNTGIWQNVKPAYRYLYAYACYIDVLADCYVIVHDHYQVNV